MKITKNTLWNLFLIVGMSIAVSIVTATKLADATQGKALLIIAAFGSIMGILSSVSSANARIVTFLFGLIDVSIYGVMCFMSWADGGGGLGNGILHVVYFVPMQFIGFFQWKKRGADAKSKPEARRFSSRQWLLYSMIFLVASCGLYVVLCQFDKSGAESFLRTAVLMDAIATVCNIIGQFLLSTAYAEQWYFWIAVNVSTIIMWVVTLRGASDPDAASYALIYIIKYAFYFLNSLNGLRIWMSLGRNSGSCKC